MLFKIKPQKALHIFRELKPDSKLFSQFIQTKQISCLRVKWRKDLELDWTIQSDKRFILCHRVVKLITNKPAHKLPLRVFENSRENLRMRFSAQAFLDRNPNLFDIYYDQIRPATRLVKHLRPSESLKKFLTERQRIYDENEGLIVTKLKKLLMMSKHKALSARKLEYLYLDFGFPPDLLTRVVPNHPDCFKLSSPGGENKFVELVSWDEELAKSVIEARAEEESKLTGVRTRPNFIYNRPKGQILKKEMREWVRDWLEMRYISPYSDASNFDRASPEMEKRSVGLLHEVLGLAVEKRIAVPDMSQFREEFQLSQDYWKAFTRHPGIFYLSLKRGMRTAFLREAYSGSWLVDRDPLLEIKDRFVFLVEEGWAVRRKQLFKRRQEILAERVARKVKLYQENELKDIEQELDEEDNDNGDEEEEREEGDSGLFDLL